MGALFVWPESTPGKSPKVGDRRVVTRFLLWPKLLDGEWRWLGFVDIEQEFQRYRVQPPEMRAMDVVGWRSVAWDRTEDQARKKAKADHERMMAVRRLATQMWVKDGGHVSVNGGGAIHQFMVQYPPTRQEYERRAEAVLDGVQ
jgi:hypothetical protein